ncbi:alkane hydroxylase MAH1-like [Arachis stenosperma]|uniref:alkane hydroxylase MAH1-like n=1 Tax=Arachis stenosperma TaxID=217475 RepID=UPI0025AD81D6|nr:alkane hydroxylase MAH1-like [Arachis stenosperma]
MYLYIFIRKSTIHVSQTQLETQALKATKMMSLLEFVIVFVAILLFFFIHLWRCNRNTPLTYWPLICMLPGILCNLPNIHDHLTSVLKHHGGTFKFRGPWLTNINFVLTSDPMNVHHITSKNFGNYGKGSEFHEIFEILGDGIFNSDSHKWKYNRDILQLLFRQNVFKNVVQKVSHKKLESCLIPLLNHASESGTVVDLQDMFQRLTFDSICSIVLGFDPKCLPNNPTEFQEVAFEKAFNKMEDTIFYRHIVPRCLWKLQKRLRIGQEKNSNESQQIVDQFLHQCISSRNEEQSGINCAKDDESNFDMLKALVEERGIGQINDKFLKDMAINLLAAGRDTISACLSWFFWLVSTHPLVEAKILEEIKEKLRTNDENWLASGVEDLNKLVYLHGALCETLRLFPPVPFEHKCAIKSDILPSGDCVSPNTMIYYSLYSMGRMEQTWGKDCLEFKPERWVSEKGINIHIPSYKFIAFNAGPRSCLGKSISFIQMKIIAIALLWNFQFQVVEGHDVCPSVSVVLHMKHGLKVNVTKRSI